MQELEILPAISDMLVIGSASIGQTRPDALRGLAMHTWLASRWMKSTGSPTKVCSRDANPNTLRLARCASSGASLDITR